jgi:hypothetical protein
MEHPGIVIVLLLLVLDRRFPIIPWRLHVPHVWCPIPLLLYHLGTGSGVTLPDGRDCQPDLLVPVFIRVDFVSVPPLNQSRSTHARLQ